MSVRGFARRIVRWSALLGAGLLALSGCIRGAPTPDPVTISFAYPAYRDAGQYEALVQQFQERYSYITVELTSMRLLTPATLEGHDVFVASQFELPQYLDQQAILSLTSFVEQATDLNADDFYPGALDVFRSQGKLWGLPTGIDMMVMYYNADIFDQYNVPYPELGWTWDDFEALAGATSHPPDVYGYALHYEGQFAVFEPVMFIYQHGGRVFDSLQNPTRATLNEPLNIEAMAWYADLIYAEDIAPMPEEVSRLGRPYPWRAVLDGRFALWSTMYSDRGGQRWPQSWEMNWGMVPLPRDRNAATLGMVDGVMISSDSEHPDAAWLWAQFLSEQMPPFRMPARRSLAESRVYEDQVGAEVAFTARAAVEDAVLVNPELWGFDSAVDAMVLAFEAIRQGEATPQIALDEAQQQSGF
jgi:ABC-type glycerol-3-phosphate transport system substrate-binding protein